MNYFNWFWIFWNYFYNVTRFKGMKHSIYSGKESTGGPHDDGNRDTKNIVNRYYKQNACRK